MREIPRGIQSRTGSQTFDRLPDIGQLLMMTMINDYDDAKNSDDDDDDDDDEDEEEKSKRDYHRS